jgi:hypothetical protein
MLKSIKFYNNYYENIVVLSNEKLDEIPYIQSMKIFYKILPDCIDINLDGFDITTVHTLFYNKSIETIIKNIYIVDYLCLSIKDLLSDIETDIIDLKPFISFIKGENVSFNVLVNNLDVNGKYLCYTHTIELYKILTDYCGGIIHRIIYEYFEKYLMYMYLNVWNIMNINLDIRQQMVVFNYEVLCTIISNILSNYDILLERKSIKDVYWRDKDNILELLKIYTNGFISSAFFELNPNLTITGGLLSAMLSMTYYDLDDYINNSYPDLDIFVVSDTKMGRSHAIGNLLDYLKNFKYFCAYKDSIISIFIKGSCIPIQLILSDYYNVFDMMSAFDMSHLQVAYNRDNGLVMTVPCYLSHRDRVTTYNKLFYIKPYRVVKAMNRGFSINYNLEIDYYIKLFGNEADFLELGKYMTRKFPKKFIMRRFLRYLGKNYTRLDKGDVLNFIVKGKIKSEGNFRNPVFDTSYNNEQVILNVNYDYVPIFRNNILETKLHKFVFGYNKIMYDGHFYRVIPDYNRNIYMWIMLRNYLDRLLKLYPLCNKYSLGLDEMNVLRVFPQHFNKNIHKIGETFVRRLVIYIHNVCIDRDILYIYFNMRVK